MRGQIGYNAEGLRRDIIERFYTKRSDSSLGRRTGRAAGSWAVSIKENGDTYIASIYSAGAPYADFGEEKTIVPRVKKWLAIPTGAALTPAGAPRYPGGPIQAAKELLMRTHTRNARRRKPVVTPRDPISWYKKDAQTILLFAKDGVTGPGLTKDKRLLFVLKRKVTRPDRTRGLMPFAEEQTVVMVNRIRNSL